MVVLPSRVLTIPGILLLSACMVGPNYKEPPQKITQHWKKTSKSVKEANIQNANWWQAFHDPVLNALIQRGYTDNLSLKATAVHVLQARAQLAQSVGELFPQQQVLNGNLTYNRIGGQSLQFVLPSEFYTDTLGASASWELDFWGKYRRAILANDANFLASYAAYDNALVTLSADIATTYIAIRTTQELINVTEKNIKVQRWILKIAQTRFREGQTSLLDVEQSQTILSQTEATLPPWRAQLQQQKDRLGVLLGTTPDKVDALLQKPRGIPYAPAGVAVGIPRETLAKRPDIYEARMKVISQSEMIGALKAELFPSFSLLGTFAFASNTINNSTLNQMFNWSSRTITAGPGFNWPILNYGQITNMVREQDAVFQQALLDYQNKVLTAQQEVQDNITQFIESRKAAEALKTANHAAISSTKLSMIRYKEGQSDFTPVLQSEMQQLNVQVSFTNAQGNIPKALVALYRSLGGGWQIRNSNDIVPTDIKKNMAARTNWGCLLKQTNHEPPKTKAQQTRERYIPDW
ncbi:MAG: efflux transporter outer membrane subunit [Legionellales bacterium]|nr:efflux transporter outer membrane subunit [Legionellales bacterium]